MDGSLYVVSDTTVFLFVMLLCAYLLGMISMYVILIIKKKVTRQVEGGHVARAPPVVRAPEPAVPIAVPDPLPTPAIIQARLMWMRRPK